MSSLVSLPGTVHVKFQDILKLEMTGSVWWEQLGDLIISRLILALVDRTSGLKYDDWELAVGVGGK